MGRMESIENTIVDKRTKEYKNSLVPGTKEYEESLVRARKILEQSIIRNESVRIGDNAVVENKTPNNFTTIYIKVEDKQRLDVCRLSPKESYGDIIRRLIKDCPYEVFNGQKISKEMM